MFGKAYLAQVCKSNDRVVPNMGFRYKVVCIS